MATVIPIASAEKFAALTASDTTKFTWEGDVVRTKALFVGGAGDLAVKDHAGNTVTFQNIPAGSVLPISTDMLLAATTATNVIGLF